MDRGGREELLTQEGRLGRWSGMTESRRGESILRAGLARQVAAFPRREKEGG